MNNTDTTNQRVIEIEKKKLDERKKLWKEDLEKIDAYNTVFEKLWTNTDICKDINSVKEQVHSKQLEERKEREKREAKERDRIRKENDEKRDARIAQLEKAKQAKILKLPPIKVEKKIRTKNETYQWTQEILKELEEHALVSATINVNHHILKKIGVTARVFYYMKEKNGLKIEKGDMDLKAFIEIFKTRLNDTRLRRV